MDFSLSEEQRALQDTARRFVREQLVDVAREMEENDTAVPADVRKRMAEMGFLGINVGRSTAVSDSAILKRSSSSRNSPRSRRHSLSRSSRAPSDR